MYKATLYNCFETGTEYANLGRIYNHPNSDH